MSSGLSRPVSPAMAIRPVTRRKSACRSTWSSCRPRRSRPVLLTSGLCHRPVHLRFARCRPMPRPVPRLCRPVPRLRLRPVARATLRRPVVRAAQAIGQSGSRSQPPAHPPHGQSLPAAARGPRRSRRRHRSRLPLRGLLLRQAGQSPRRLTPCPPGQSRVPLPATRKMGRTRPVVRSSPLQRPSRPVPLQRPSRPVPGSSGAGRSTSGWRPGRSVATQLRVASSWRPVRPLRRPVHPRPVHPRCRRPVLPRCQPCSKRSGTQPSRPVSLRWRTAGHWVAVPGMRPVVLRPQSRRPGLPARGVRLRPVHRPVLRVRPLRTSRRPSSRQHSL